MWPPDFIPRHAKRYFDSPTTSIAAQTIPTPAPPVTADSQQVLQAQQALARQIGQQKTVKKTIYAGDFAYNPGAGGGAGQPGGAPQTGYKT